MLRLHLLLSYHFFVYLADITAVFLLLCRTVYCGSGWFLCESGKQATLTCKAEPKGGTSILPVIFQWLPTELRTVHYARYTHITFYAVTTYATYADQYANISA